MKHVDDKMKRKIMDAIPHRYGDYNSLPKS